jgi:hypothetical protein
VLLLHGSATWACKVSVDKKKLSVCYGRIVRVLLCLLVTGMPAIPLNIICIICTGPLLVELYALQRTTSRALRKQLTISMTD